jgi:predicted RNase H-like HicB family nuclease
VEKMKYLGYVELGDNSTATGVVLPDFPGCFSAVDDSENLNLAVQEAVELHFDGEDFKLPIASKLQDVVNLPEYNYNGVWAWFDINVDKISTKTKRINITIPENLLHKVDELAAAEHISRSAKIAKLIAVS